MDIRSDRQKGLSYVELGRKYHMDPRTAKRYAESPQKPEYTLSEPKPTKMDPYKQIVDEWLEEAPYSALRILEKLREIGVDTAQPPKPQQRTLKELAECAEAGLPLTPEEVERLEAHRNRKKAALQDLKARAETDPEAAAELAQQRTQQSEAVKKSRQKMYADAAAGDPEAQARYERFLAVRRENYHRKKQAEAEAAQAS